jgi:hypothetical protein
MGSGGLIYRIHRVNNNRKNKIFFPIFKFPGNSL